MVGPALKKACVGMGRYEAEEPVGGKPPSLAVCVFVERTLIDVLRSRSEICFLGNCG